VTAPEPREDVDEDALDYLAPIPFSCPFCGSAAITLSLHPGPTTEGLSAAGVSAHELALLALSGGDSPA
jgi:hypothetical protein